MVKSRVMQTAPLEKYADLFRAEKHSVTDTIVPGSEMKRIRLKVALFSFKQEQLPGTVSKDETLR